MAGDWGYRGSAEADKQAAEKSRRQSSAQEFFLKSRETRKVLFLEDVRNGVGSDATFAIYRHHLKIDGSFPPMNVTCTRDMDTGCEVCKRKWRNSKGEEVPFKRDMFWFVTIMDLTPWQRDDKVFYATKRVIPMKQKLFERLCGKSERRREAGSKDGLKMWLFSAFRQPDMRGNQDVSWKTGNEFDHIDHIEDPFKPIKQVRLIGKEKQDLGPHPGLIGPDSKPMNIDPVNYRETLAPIAKDDLEKLFKEHAVTCGMTFGERGGGSPEGASAPSTAADAVHYDQA